MIGKCSSPLSLPSLSIDPFRRPISTNSFLFLPSRSTDIQHRHRRQLHRWWQLENVDWTMTGFSFAQLKYKRSMLKI
ncbi:hypothetical protein B296_00030829 [Ensete ventricosum]|uniref:Uncharacterized protein n=1 Tax=Ensete ventricosum TaxID=4639 RepID=A0A426ZIF4_ENSVE|nr:hypothetical protein B296_00030829 [Ensete ventricosum]